MRLAWKRRARVSTWMLAWAASIAAALLPVRAAYCLGRRLLLYALVMGFCHALPGQSLAEGTVRDVSLLPYSDGVRVVVDLGRRVPFVQRTLDGPPRLLIDLPDVSWLLPRQRGTQSYRFVKGFRFGRLQQGASRLVVDIDRPFEIERVFELSPSDGGGHRIVADLRPLPSGGRMVPQEMRSEPVVARNELHWRPQAKPRERPLTRAEPPRVPRWRAPERAAPRQRATYQPGPQPRVGKLKRMIVLDPGHGGIDPGASGKNGTYEKNVVLSMALELRRQLLDTGRYDVVLTRGDDSFVRLRDRLQIARASGGSLFLSLHADSLAKAAEVHGAAVYTLSDKASSEEAARLASNENRADILGGIDLSHHEPIVTQILIDLAQRDANGKSLRFADIMVEELSSVTKMLRKEQQQAGFVVLKSPDMPSALIELGYLSNSRDEKRLNDADHLSDLGEAMLEAIDRYFESDQL